ncbi:MAG: hypothetical protein NTX50_16155 [Candidatus Sumerlaeota bacterium]|nr:hypothetical protein [Candidatus Sumerlaeota bacterium]
MPWVYDPHSGGVKIPKAVQERTRQRILAHAEKNYRGSYLSLDIRFRGALCYIDAFEEPDVPSDWPPPHWGETREQALQRLRSTPIHLVRLRYFAEDRWSVAFFTYSNEKYEPSMFPSGSFHGTPEEAFDIGATYLQDAN